MKENKISFKKSLEGESYEIDFVNEIINCDINKTERIKRSIRNRWKVKPGTAYMKRKINQAILKNIVKEHFPWLRPGVTSRFINRYLKKMKRANNRQFCEIMAKFDDYKDPWVPA